MTNHEDPNNQESDKNLLLEKINMTLSELGSKAKYLKLPRDLEEYKPLKGKKVLMLDDVQGLLEAFIPDLMVATDGNTSYVLYKGEKPEEVAKRIIEQNPEITLLDYKLSESVNGTDVYKVLKENGFVGMPIGFSSERDATINSFKRAGVENCVEKDTFDTSAIVKEIAKLVEKQNQ